MLLDTVTSRTVPQIENRKVIPINHRRSTGFEMTAYIGNSIRMYQSTTLLWAEQNHSSSSAGTYSITRPCLRARHMHHSVASR